MNRRNLLLLPIAFGLAACNRNEPTGSTAAPAGTGSGTSDGDVIQIGYVLHGLNDFTQVIKKGAEDAQRDLPNVRVEVTGPAGFVTTEAIGMFEGMVQKGKQGLVVVPQPGEVWVTPIREAVNTAKIPVVTVNVTSPGSAASAWFGQDEYNSGVLLAKELRKILEAEGKKSGKILFVAAGRRGRAERAGGPSARTPNLRSPCYRPIGRS
jgi:ABC-type sugar transport system substrate-binding protein